MRFRFFIVYDIIFGALLSKFMRYMMLEGETGIANDKRNRL
jgi:hypothetical protein